ncbi:CAMK protein kinase [Saprolegnia parasitica CBS 223.65]|uniref:CAMK protein kinase n=1 Tax=Saprolegnia parasitica (strain CBS 223.65) TaxID=695850 RepID=A0A067BQG3_SAPPC|nr:CAMK protein kinase [Saprolegnia parasitica CBS 223.65]KDO20508.1 CAMK protein kinase [Saprolegnia parasitica CBS 223.65]|eukprot:XP_012208771.1 CAMK protein kinase [Saprolegnia parasitica CBS 223.65]
MMMDEYIIGRVLYEEPHGAVHKVLHRPQGRFFSMRVLDKERMSFEDEIEMQNELEVLKVLHHPHLLNVHAIFAEGSQIYIVCDLVEGGDVFDRLVAKESYTEREARDLIKTLLETIAYCHDQGVVHRNLKPESIKLTSVHDNTNIKLTDFSFAASVHEEHTSICGAPDYVAPEILANSYSHSPYGAPVDVWAIGVITFVLLSGFLPFYGDDQDAIFASITRGQFEFDGSDWASISAQAKDCITQMLIHDPKQRPTARELLSHPWMTSTQVASKPLRGAQEELRRLNLQRKFRAAVLTVSATVALQRAFCAAPVAPVRPTLRRQGSVAVPYVAEPESASAALLKNYAISTNVLSEGKALVVREAVEVATGHRYAVKFYEKDLMTFEDEIDLNRQVSVLQSIAHPNVECLHHYYAESDHYCLVTDLPAGGDLFERIVAKDNGYSERDARALVRELLHGVAHLHAQGVVHRNIKPESIFLRSQDDDIAMVLTNFGFATQDDGRLTYICGSLDYTAPEVLANRRRATPYGPPVDVWSIGVLTYVLLSGYLPFYGNDPPSLEASITRGTFVFDSPYWDGVTDDAKRIISAMLVADPAHRATAAQLLEHPWFHANHVAATPLTAAKDELRRVLLKRKFRCVVRTVKAAMTLARLAKSSSTTSASFHAKYVLYERIGQDGVGVLHRASTIEASSPVHVVYYDTRRLSAEVVAGVTREVQVLRRLDHPHTIKVLDYYDAEPDGLYLVLTAVTGDQLFDRIVDKDCYSEAEARALVKVLLDAVLHCHAAGVVHSNLKPETIVLTKPDDDTWLVLTRFGRPHGRALEYVLLRTYQRWTNRRYVAPESLFRVVQSVGDAKSFEEAPVDIWSIGVITYVLLCGYLPFHGANQFHLFKAIKRGKVLFDAPYWSTISTNATSFISAALVVDPAKRATIGDLLAHPWMRASQVPTTSLDVGSELRRLQARRKLKGVMSAVKASVGLGRLFDSTPVASA